MNMFTSFVVYFLTWWVVLFAVLPIGIRHNESRIAGAMSGAPDKPNIKKIILLTTLIAAIIWLIIFGLVQSDWISFRQMARSMQ